MKQIEQRRETIPVMATKAVAIAVVFWFFSTQVENHGEPLWIAGLLSWGIVEASAKGLRALCRWKLRLIAALDHFGRSRAGAR